MDQATGYLSIKLLVLTTTWRAIYWWAWNAIEIEEAIVCSLGSYRRKQMVEWKNRTSRTVAQKAKSGHIIESKDLAEGDRLNTRKKGGVLLFNRRRID